MIGLSDILSVTGYTYSPMIATGRLDMLTSNQYQLPSADKKRKEVRGLLLLRFASISGSGNGGMIQQ